MKDYTTNARKTSSGALPAPSLQEIVSRTKPLTGRLPEAIIRAQSTGRSPADWGAVPCGSYSGAGWTAFDPAVQPEASDSHHWYCVRTHPRAEYRALLALSQLKFRPYCPTFLSQRQIREKGVPFRDVIEPLFPRYIFVAFDRHRDPWRSIFGADGVEWLMIAANEKPMAVPSAVIEALRGQGRAGDGVIDMRTHTERQRSEAYARRDATAAMSISVTYYPPIEVDRTVKILSGPFAGFHGICTMSAADRVRLLVDIFGRSSSVEVKQAEVEAV
jgi:transcription antitermination factor NusG